MIDVTTAAGMEMILELRKTKKIQQIIDEYGLDCSEGALSCRIRRYKEKGRPTYKRHRLIDRDILVELAARGCYQTEAARLINSTPLQVSRCARKYGIVFRSGKTTDGRQPKMRAPVEPTLSQDAPIEIRQLLRQPWASPAVRHISASRFLV